MSETITVTIQTENYHAFAKLVDAIDDGLNLAADRHGDIHRTSISVERSSGNIRQVAKWEAEDNGSLVEVD